MKRHVMLIGGAAMSAALALSATAAAKTTITVGVIWGEQGEASAGFEPAAKLYEQSHPDVEIKYLWSTGLADNPNDPATTKVVTLTAAGEAPDLVMVGGQSVPEYAVKGFLLPLDSFINAGGVKKSDFIPAAWGQTLWNNQKYAMTLEVDPNFALLWNKQMFADNGLDPDAAPKTIADLQTAFEKLTKEDNGKVSQIGMMPWSVYGNSNTIYTWGWIYGGDFYDAANQKVTANDPNVVDAVTYLRDMYKRYGSYNGGGFPTGKVGMAFAVSSNMLTWVKGNPDIKFGIGLEPYKADTSAPNPAWIGGWALGISKSAQHPKEAWDFLRFITGSPEGTNAFADPSGWVPAYLPSPIFNGKFSRDPYMSVYLQVALSARHQRPAMPAVADYANYLDQALSDVESGKKQPKEALDYVTDQVQRKLAEMLAK